MANLLAGDEKADWEVFDQDLIYALYRWHNTKNKKEVEEFRRLHTENDRLTAENNDLKNRMMQISTWVK